MDEKDDLTVRRNSRSVSVHEHDIGFEWNTYHENLLKLWGERSQYYSVMHDRAGKYYSKWNKYLRIPCKVILALVGSIQFAQLSNLDNVQWSSYLSGFLAIVGFMIEMGHEFLGFDIVAAKHFSASMIYDKLYMDVSIELSHPAPKRSNVRAFVRRIRQILANTKGASPDIPIHILDKYMTEINNKLLLPNPIEIYIDTKPPTLNSNIHDKCLSISVDNNLHKDMTTQSNLNVNVDTNEDRTQPNMTTIKQSASSITDDQPISDIQDEFAAEMEKRLQSKKDKIEEYQMKRFASHMSNNK